MNKDLHIALQMFVDHFIGKVGEPPTIDQINDFLQSTAMSMSSAPRENFEGYSSEQMHNLIHFLWNSGSMIEFKELSEDNYSQIPLLRQIIKLTSILAEKGKIKLTVTGALPLSIVRDVYSVGTPDWYIEEHQTKRLTENDSMTVQRTLVMLKLISAIKVQKGVMTLTARGKKIIKDKHQLLSEILQAYTYSFNWAYFDGYECEDVGRMGAGFSLAMVAKYGTDWKRDNFYANKYFKAFPILAMEKMWREEVPGETCYTTRTFERFMLELGLIEMKEEKVNRENDSVIQFDIHKYVRKTALFDKMLEFNL